MAGMLNLQIITPERIVFDKQVEQVTATAVDGELTILPDHEPIITALGINIIRFKSQGNEAAAAVIGGLLEVTDNRVIVLSDAAELDIEIDEARAHQAKERAEAEKIQRTDKIEVYVIELALARAITRLKAAELSKRRQHAIHN